MPRQNIRFHEPKPLETTPIITRANPAEFLSGDAKKINGSDIALQNFLGLPKDLPAMADVDAASLNGTLGLLTRSAGLLNMSNPLMQTAGLIGLGYAIKPDLVKGFLGTSTAANVIGGFASLQVGGMLGSTLSRSATLGGIAGGAAGYGIGAALGMSIPFIGAALGFLGGLFGGHSARKAKRQARDRAYRAMIQMRDSLENLRDQKTAQYAAMDEFLAHSDNALKNLAMGTEFVDFQAQRLAQKRDQNIEIISKNIKEAMRVNDLKNDAIKMETKKTLGQQMVSIGNRGVSDAGSSWYITAETEGMGTRAQKELRLSFESILDKENMKYQSLLEDYEEGAKQLDYAAKNINIQGSNLQATIKKTKTQFDVNMRQIDRNMRTVERNYMAAERAFREYGGRGRFMNFSNMFDLAGMYDRERQAESMTAISLGTAIASTKAGVNPFDALLNYNML